MPHPAIIATMPTLIPENESSRLEALRHYDILDTLPEESYDDIVSLAAHICGTPVAAINFVDDERQWAKAQIGMDEAELSRDVSFCAHAILSPDKLMVVPEAQHDVRFADNPLVTGPAHLRFYAGAPLVTAAGDALGTLCVAAPVARTLSSEQEHALAALARQVMGQLELRRAVMRLEAQQQELERTNALLAVQSATDPLTGLRNRRVFEERLETDIKHAWRYGTPLSLLILDVDHFKNYNDAFGHPAGDEALRQVAALLLSNVRSTDLVARYGGEEFVVLLPNTEAEGALLLAERCRRAVEMANWPKGGMTISVGVAAVTPGVWNGKDLLGAADRALYEAKRGGRNRVSGPLDIRA